jgi:hypothetical protein
LELVVVALVVELRRLALRLLAALAVAVALSLNVL